MANVLQLQQLGTLTRFEDAEEVLMSTASGICPIVNHEYGNNGGFYLE